MSLIKLLRRSLIALTLCAVMGLAACTPVTIQIGAPSPTTAPTVAASPTIQLATDTPSPTSPPSPTSAPPPPPITIVVPPPQPPPPQQPTHPASPAKPSDFKADGAGTTIAFTWIDNSVNELGFRIYQVGEVAPVITLPAHTATGGMSYDWPGRPCNFSTSFYIRAYNDNGESSSSNSDGAVTIPCPPVNFAATGSGTTINFNWTVSGSHNESGFRIYQQGVSAPVVTRPPNPAQALQLFRWTGLPCNLVGTYFVRAFNSAGESLDTNHDGAVTTPCAPSNLAATGISKTAVYLMFTDHATNEDGFTVYRDGGFVHVDLLPSHGGTGGAVGIVANQLCGSTHSYAIRAYNTAGESDLSNSATATTYPC